MEQIDTYFITCSSDDECFINCESSTGCTNMFLVCNDACYLNCGDYGDATGNGCPSTISRSGIWRPLNSTVNVTTFVIPTQDPTNTSNINSTSAPTELRVTSTLATMSNNRTEYCNDVPTTDSSM